MKKLTVGDLGTIEALTSRSPLRWVGLDDVDLDAPQADDDPPDEALVDYWSVYFHRHDSGTGDVTLRQVLDDFVELVVRFTSNYALAVLDGSIGSLVRQAPDREEMIRELEAVRDASHEDLRAGWNNLLADCRIEP